jgi:hypothetical protein
MDVSTLTVKQAADLIPDAAADWLASNMLYYQGDHWQAGAGWSGPLLDNSHSLYRQTMVEIQRSFVSKNSVGEVVGRHVNAVLGREPAWRLAVRRPLQENEAPSAAEQQLIDEAEAILTEWWDARDIPSQLQTAATNALLARRGSLRLFTPPGERDENGLIPKADLKSSIMRLYVHSPDPKQAAVILDRQTMRQIGIYIYQAGENDKRAEIMATDAAGKTVIRIAVEGEAEPEPPVILAVGGRLLVFEIKRPRLVTEQVIQGQKLLNLSLTMLQRNVIQGGFLERTFFNTQLPGKEVPDPDRPGLTRFVPEPLHVGAGVSNFLTGVTVEREDGSLEVATPSVVYRDPVPVDVFTKTKQAAYQSILEEVGQLHALLSGDAAASGESRKQALTDFRQSLLETKAESEAATRWLLETTLALAAIFSGQPGRYDALRAVAECRLELGPVSADDKRVAKELVDAEIISRETARTMIGVDDPDAEAAKIDIEQEALSERSQKTLAAAVLNAQRQLDGGSASNGLEQPQ